MPSFTPKIYVSPQTIQINFLIDNALAVAELSGIDPKTAQDFLSESQGAYKKVVSLAQGLITPETPLYFFNRLNVPEKLRQQGIGTLLLNELETVAKEKNALIINTASSYGELSQKDLIAFYQAHHFQLIHKDGLLVYHPQLEAMLLSAHKTIKLR